MADLSKYVPKRIDHWRANYAERIGWDALNAYDRMVSWFLYRMKFDEPFNIEMKIPREEWDIFVKCMCEYIRKFNDKQDEDPEFHHGVFFDVTPEYNIITKRKF